MTKFEDQNLRAFFSLLRNEIDKVPLPSGLVPSIKELYTLSKKHDLSHLVFDSAIKNELIDQNSETFHILNNQIIIAITRYKQQSYEFERICSCFQQNNIQFVPLKGLIIRDYYPEPWMRTSCDIDILINEEDLKKATESLLSIGFTSDGVRNYHDVSFFLGNTHLELHFNICESNKQLDTLLKDVWKYTDLYDRYEYRENNIFFMFHHIAHMAYHFLSGGCGVRPVLDLWILRKKYHYSEELLLDLLNKCKLTSFYNNVCLLSEIWFGDCQHNETTLKMERRIIEGGAYGSFNNGASAGIAMHKGSKTRYKLSIAFPPYIDMCNIYPYLRKHKIMLPFCYVCRLFTKLFGKRKRIATRSTAIDSCSKEEIRDFATLLKDLELNC